MTGRHSAPKPGDKVAWQTAQGMTHGKVVRKLTAATHIKGHAVAATPAQPQYEVQSDKAGALAAHKAPALKKI